MARTTPPQAQDLPTVCLDFGHGGKDSGAVGPNGLMEKSVVLSVGMLVAAQLTGLCHVAYTRKDDTFIELTERCRIANESKAKVFVSIHCNSAENPAANGIETWIARGTTTAVPLGEALQDQMTDEFPGRVDRGVKRAGYVVLKGTDMPAALVELEFIHNDAGEAHLGDRQVQAKYAKAIADGIKVFLGLKEPVTPPVIAEPVSHPPCTVSAGTLEALAKIAGWAGQIAAVVQEQEDALKP